MNKQTNKRDWSATMADLAILAVIVLGAGKVVMAVFGIN